MQKKSHTSELKFHRVLKCFWEDIPATSSAVLFGLKSQNHPAHLFSSSWLDRGTCHPGSDHLLEISRLMKAILEPKEFAVLLAQSRGKTPVLGLSRWMLLAKRTHRTIAHILIIEFANLAELGREAKWSPLKERAKSTLITSLQLSSKNAISLSKIG